MVVFPDVKRHGAGSLAVLGIAVDDPDVVGHPADSVVQRDHRSFRRFEGDGEVADEGVGGELPQEAALEEVRSLKADRVLIV